MNINNRSVKYNDDVRQIIRNIIYSLKFKNINPSLNTLLKNIRANEQLPLLSLTTLRRLLGDMGFYYEKDKNTNKIVLVETLKEPLLKNASKPPVSTNVTPPVLTASNQNSDNIQGSSIYLPNQRLGHNVPFQHGNQINHIQMPPNYCMSYQVPPPTIQLQHVPHNYISTSNRIL
ncbi:unnamed protein product [Acanthoscelides obtectus]|uniref:Uncharacterized protein n=1 Tax=Acanthoscelides obtectus TaxID=200917 RepID=A0A9P0LBH4_ACAOB|nr:unnamed protein product [Acanthoscelides obtectus]CAK1672493.1 hypothetical protein AOBTE_LOCUS28931 [Acanthoscelides obtectus]